MRFLSARIVCAGVCVALAACGSTTQPGRDGIVRGPAPYAALTSSDAALKVAFDEVCVPTVLAGGDFATLAKTRYMVEMKPVRDSTGQSSQVFRLASIDEVTATLWADGSCMVGIERGDSEALSAKALASLEARGHVMAAGISSPAPNDGTRAAWCNSDPRPLMLAITTPTGKASKRQALVATLYRAKGGASDICRR
ncbi:MAG: hypothetical protein SGJ21_05445 [Alphaproteobacteria bacterium]|nr:hypothetical protein [Alphaproteobacteria bacterium]